MAIKYLVRPGFVASVNDGDRHWVTGPQLAKLYGLRPGTWRNFNEDLDRTTSLPVLGVRAQGDYPRPMHEENVCGCDDTDRQVTVHACPPEGSGIMPCCGRVPFETSSADRITAFGPLVNCAGRLG